MAKKLPVLVLLFCLVVPSAPYHAQAGSSRSGDCSYSCQKRKEAEILAIIYGGTFAVAMTVGAVYWLIRGDDGESEIASRSQMMSGQRFRLAPHYSQSGGQGLNLEIHLSDDALIGLRAAYIPSDGEVLTRVDASYFGGAFCRLSF
jgi:hypothetical protein